jgi:WD40 repeat protein
VSPSGRFVTGADQSGAVAMWDLKTGAHRTLWRHAMTSFTKFSADGGHIASASWDSTVRVGEPSGGPVQRVRAGGLAKYSVALDRHATRVAFGGSDSDPRVVIVSLRDGRRVILRGHTEIVWDIDFSPDGAHVVTASEDGTARLWNAANGHLERTLEGHGEGVTTARYSPNGKFVVTAGKDGTARVWPVAGGSSRILRGHAGPVSSAAFNARGDRVVTAGADGSVRVWSSRGGDPLITVDTHLDEAHGAAFTPDGRRVVSVGEDGVIRAVDCDVCEPFPAVLSLARARVRMNLSASDQKRYLPQGG